MLTLPSEDLSVPLFKLGDIVDVCNGRISVVVAKRLHVFERMVSGFHEHAAIELPFEADQVWLAPSGRFAIARRAGGDQICSCDLRRGAVSPPLTAPEPARQQIVAAVGVVNAQELALCVRTGSELEAYAPETGALLWQVDCETFRFTKLVGLDGAVIAVGFFAGETKESLAVIDLATAASDPSQLFAQFRAKRGLTDHAYRLSTGPAGVQTFVTFRDPEDDETAPATDGDDAALHGFAGLYIRDLAGTVIDRNRWAASKVGALAAGPTWIAIEERDRVQLVARAPGTERRTERARWLAADRDGSRVLVESDDRYRLLEL